MLTVPRVCFLILMITATALSWVHQQVELVTTSYQIAQKEREVMDLESVRSRLQYRVLTLESPVQLDKRLHQADRRLSVREPARVVRKDPSLGTSRTGLAKAGNQKNGFWEFFVHSAEAKEHRSAH
ncbi:MAG: hypothetical protein HYS56_04200 [Candidatus Omnitrophica bacterium]|nr:hypothetical protein [Candidatus Omnitrophota bacterium]